MPFNATVLDGVLKNWYNKERMANLFYKDFALLDYFTKNPNGTGKKNVFPIIFGSDEGMAATLADAQTIAAANGGGPALDDWVCSWGKYESALQITEQAIRMSASDMGSFIDATKLAIDGHLRKWSQVMSRYLATSKSRNLGSFTMTSGVGTLTYPSDIVNYSKNMQIRVSADDGSGTGHALRTGIGYVIAVNPNAGTFTVSATDGGSAGDPDASWGSGATSYAFRLGDFGGGATPAIVLDGLGDWVPATDPGATAFNGVDRTQNITALSGTRLTAAEILGVSLEGRIKKLCNKMFYFGFGAPDTVWLDPTNWQELANALESKGVKPITATLGKFGFDVLELTCAGGKVKIATDRFMPFGAIYATKKEACKIDSLGESPSIVNGDGLKMLRLATANTYEMRYISFPCTSMIPGYLGRTSAP